MPMQTHSNNFDDKNLQKINLLNENNKLQNFRYFKLKNFE